MGGVRKRKILGSAEGVRICDRDWTAHFHRGRVVGRGWGGIYSRQLRLHTSHEAEQGNTARSERLIAVAFDSPSHQELQRIDDGACTRPHRTGQI